MALQTTITTLRHAHTHYNAQRRYAGSRNVPLSEEGIHDALETADRLNRIKFDVIITSKQGRAVQTARILRMDSAPLVQSALCNERCFGVMEGLTWDEVQDQVAADTAKDFPDRHRHKVVEFR